MTMNKEKTKKSVAQYNVNAIDAISQKHGFSPYYIRQSINKKVDGITPDTLQKDYKKLKLDIETATAKVINDYLKN